MKENRVLHGLIKTGGLLLAGVAAMLALSFAHADKASAASYQKIEWSAESGLQYSIKAGNFCFYTKDRSEVYCSREPGGSLTYQGSASYGCYTNGKYTISISNNGKKLQRRECATGKLKNLKKLNKPRYGGWTIQAVYKDRVYLNRWNYPSSFKEYIYNLKTGKMKRTNKNYDIKAQCGSRMIASSIKPNEMYVQPLFLCTSTKKGFKKNKTLAKYGGSGWAIGNKFYYVKYTTKKGNKAILYKCKPNGKGRVKLGTFKGKSHGRIGPVVWISNLTEKGCDVEMNEKAYHYLYATKKLTQFNPYEDEDEEDY